MKKRMLIQWFSALLVFGMVFSAGAMAEQAESEYTLAQVTVLSRHSIRSPLSDKGSVLSEITPHEWFAWTSNPGELSLRGAMLETTMGQYFRLWLEKEGLFPENYIPEEGAVRIYANGFQRTQATARYFSAGLLPVAVVPVECHVDYNEPDGTFLPLIQFMEEDYAQDVLEEIYERGGGEGLQGYTDSLDDALHLLVEVADLNESEAYVSGEYGNLLEDDSVMTLEEGQEPKISGALKTACSVADALVLQYYEEPDEKKAAFGHELTQEDWRTIGGIVSTYEKILFSAPLLSVNVAHPMLEELYAELKTPERRFTYLCGHDSTLISVLSALGAEEYYLPGAVEPATPTGTKLVFERWQNSSQESFYKVKLVCQSADQLRSIQPLSLEIPPVIVPLSFEGIVEDENGMIREQDLTDLFERKINELYELEEFYTGNAALEEAA